MISPDDFFSRVGPAVPTLVSIYSVGVKCVLQHTCTAVWYRLCLDPNFGVPKYTVVFRLYLVIIVQPLTN
jgi:hypothetical protein